MLNNNLYALTAMNDKGESDRRVFKWFQKYAILHPAIPVGRKPQGIAVSPDSGHVFVTNYADNNVSVIEVNLTDNPPFRVLPAPVATGRRPLGIALSPDGKYVFVTNEGDNSVTVFDGTPPFRPVSTPVPAGNAPTCLAVSPDGRYVFVGSGSLSVIDTASAPKSQ